LDDFCSNHPTSRENQRFRTRFGECVSNETCTTEHIQVRRGPHDGALSAFAA
jgi:hypothetical protein